MRDILTVSSSPHIKTSENTRDIMADVLIALTPAAIFGCLLFGIKAAILLAVSVVTAIVAELLWDLLLKKPISIGGCSAAVTGLLLGMNLSVKTPVFVAVIGSAVAIIVVKQMFGGLGHNFVNPAIAARIVLLVSFPKAMSSFADP
ncbi:MAG: RnfABCDGE type electron transport complex subunit D, partial [Clostridia bacterium]|nr:RnfABCDGE type electron transport complex subunit D [Clostridia bacterium]